MKCSIDDLEKALRYAKKHHAVVVTIEIEHLSTGLGRLHMDVSEAYKGSGAKITVFSAESAKMPEVTKTETLFE